jgi:hypothetical protein
MRWARRRSSSRSWSFLRGASGPPLLRLVRRATGKGVPRSSGRPPLAAPTRGGSLLAARSSGSDAGGSLSMPSGTGPVPRWPPRSAPLATGARSSRTAARREASLCTTRTSASFSIRRPACRWGSAPLAGASAGNSAGACSFPESRARSSRKEEPVEDLAIFMRPHLHARRHSSRGVGLSRGRVPRRGLERLRLSARERQ